MSAEPLTYVITQADARTVNVLFNRQPAESVRDALHELGAGSTGRGATTWRCSARKREELEDLCRRAAERSRRLAEQMDETLCWTCARSAGRRMEECPWADHFEPVPGWTATATKVYDYTYDDKTYYFDSYCVAACPLFTPDPVRERRKNNEPV